MSWDPKKNRSTEVDCTICLENINTKDNDSKTLDCKHLFHKVCIDSWLRQSNLCPTCRGEVKGVQPVAPQEPHIRQIDSEESNLISRTHSAAMNAFRLY